ncbi:hypothetical protein [Paenibacillus jilunlii]|uniref:Uncharacterized protein n=1 Tax=Paenibacillus jilunlii TaxID=682956 RepID=A0ABR5SS01_9BACL|nr:hypothetical protein [Paenibacillus jilunlii]KWX73514.1 hypothetical protein AML91_17690 [Paenibacillus jilunlii]
MGAAFCVEKRTLCVPICCRQTAFTDSFPGFEICFGQKEFFLSLIQANLYGEFQTLLANILSQKLSFVKERTGLDDRSWQYFIQVRTAMLLSALRVAITQFNEDNPPDVLETLNKLFGKQPALFN